MSGPEISFVAHVTFFQFDRYWYNTVLAYHYTCRDVKIKKNIYTVDKYNFCILFVGEFFNPGNSD